MRTVQILSLFCQPGRARGPLLVVSQTRPTLTPVDEVAFLNRCQGHPGLATELQAHHISHNRHVQIVRPHVSTDLQGRTMRCRGMSYKSSSCLSPWAGSLSSSSVLRLPRRFSICSAMKRSLRRHSYLLGVPLECGKSHLTSCLGVESQMRLMQRSSCSSCFS